MVPFRNGLSAREVGASAHYYVDGRTPDTWLSLNARFALDQCLHDRAPEARDEQRRA